MNNSVLKFLSDNQDMINVIDTYMKVRHELKKMGHTEESIENISEITQDLAIHQRDFDYFLRRLTDNVRDIFDIDREQLLIYVKKRLDLINELIPLNDGNKKGRN